jgi:TRAP-type C4-dicarboxylate transport system permease large subunit
MLNIGSMLADFITATTSSPYAFMFIVCVILTILGFFIEAAAVRLILYPLLIPTASAYSIDPIHFAMIFTYLTLLGHSTPPVGPGMFITNAIAECSVEEYLRDGWPLLVAQFAVAPVLIFFPGTVTWLPNFILGQG